MIAQRRIWKAKHKLANTTSRLTKSRTPFKSGVREPTMTTTSTR